MGEMPPASRAPALSKEAARNDAWRRPLRDDFHGPGFSPSGGLYYRDNFEQSAGKLEFQTAVKLTGSSALKLSVRPIAAAAGVDGHSERAEIWEKTELWAPYGQGIWYGFAVRFADPIPQDDHRYLIAQWKREIDAGSRGQFQPVPGAADDQRQALRYGRDQPHRAAADVWSSSAVPTFFRPHAEPDAGPDRRRPVLDGGRRQTLQRIRAPHSPLRISNPLPRPSSGWIEFAIYVKPGPNGAATSRSSPTASRWSP